MTTRIPSLITVILFTTLFSCQKEAITPTIVATATTTTMMAASPAHSSTSRVDNTAGGSLGYLGVGCPATTVSLIAGQHIDAGTISVSNDNDFIYVTYTTANGYLLTQTHLYVGDCEGIPVNKKGNPVPGQFPYKGTQNYTTTFTCKVPVTAIGLGQCGCIAAHAVVVKLDAAGRVTDAQTAWGAGSEISTTAGNWGTKMNYCTCVAESAD
ncbi:hypothetical protein QWZ08_01360 [Ferruginibacter paludis]|uniref:hypothetical protein n=1 Tax=Ferruginibacter paludis TaxID=1310417 RepID=UPI0025B3BD11|nr:hypothetical protein [Ferruginibacter paludis]MDN3654251.1 hypothetical protein [Ferruginibacter paludis]